jgi:anti-sigma B factor antagonist
MSLSITSREVDGVSIINLDGRIVFGEEAESLRDKVKNLIDVGRKNLILNVDHVTFVDSAGLGALVSAHHAASAQGGTLRLCHVGPKVKQMFRMTKLDNIFKVSETEADAIQSFSK